MRTAAIVTMAAAVLVGVACSGGPTAPTSEGARLYAQLGCARCHGDAREGTRTAPPLHGLAAHWEADPLKAYLQNPGEEIHGNPRLQALAQEWAVAMTPAQTSDPAQLDVLVGFLLNEG